MARNQRSKSLLGALLIAGALAGCGRGHAVETPRTHAVRDGADATVPSVQTVLPVRQPLVVKFDQPGVVEASESASLFARVSGYVRTIHADIGDKVRAGQVLLEVDVPELAQDLAFKQALVAEARAALAQANAGVAAAQGALQAHASQLLLAHAEVHRAQSECEFRHREHDRYADLASKNASTQQLLDERKLVLQTAESACASAEARLKTVENEKIVLEARLASAEADAQKAGAHVAVAEADRDKTKTIFEYARLKAPFDGVVTARTVDLGEYVASPGSDRATPLFTLERCDPVTIVLKVPEREVPAVRIGSRVTVRFDALKHREMTGAVTRLSSNLDSRSRTMRVEIDVSNADAAIYPGMYAAVSLTLADVDDALTVPASAIYSRGAELYVFVVRDGKVSLAKVQTGYDDGRIVEILDGLSGSEQVIVSNKGELTEGQSVRAVAAQRDAPSGISSAALSPASRPAD